MEIYKLPNSQISFWQLETVQHCLSAAERVLFLTDYILVTLNVNDDDDDDEFTRQIISRHNYYTNNNEYELIYTQSLMNKTPGHLLVVAVIQRIGFKMN